MISRGSRFSVATAALSRRWFSTGGCLSAARAADRQQSYEQTDDRRSSSRDSYGQSKSSQTAVVTKLPNQLTVASVENNSLLSRVAVAVKAGPRYEPAETPGISHVLRNAAALATKHCSAFALSRTIEQLGCNMAVTGTREYIIYVLEGQRNYVEQCMPFFASVITQPELRSWEVGDIRPRLLAELAEYEAQPELVAAELLHDAAFRGTLRNSLYAPKFSVAGIGAGILKEYHAAVFQPNRISIGGLGIDQSTLLQWATEYFGDLSQKSSTSSSSSNDMISAVSAKAASNPRYAGGQRRHETSDYLAYAILATEGAGASNLKEFLSAALLQQYLGDTPAIKWPTDSFSKLSKAVAGSLRNPFGVSAYNVSYSDTGLFGFSMVSAYRDAPNVMKACFQQMKAVADGGIPDKVLDGVKDGLKTKIACKNLECGKTYARSIAVQALVTGEVLTPEALMSEIDSIGADDVKKFTSGLKKTSLSIGASGNLANMPFVEDLISQ